MRTRMQMLAGLLAVSIAAVAPDAAQGQGRGQQQRMQDRIHRTDQQIERLDRMQERIRTMDQRMTEQMDQMRQRLNGDAAQQLQEQPRRQETDRLRQHERLQAMAGSLGQMSQHMKQAMQQVRAMEADPGYEADAEMQREMEQLRQHLQKMNDDVEEGVRLMERLHQRTRQSQPAP